MESSSFKKRLEKLIGGEKPFSWATKVGISGATFSRMWNEGVPPKADTLEKIARETGASIDWLLIGQGPMRRDERGHGNAGEELTPYIAASGLKSDVLRDVVEEVENYLQRHKLQLEPDKKAELITYLYEEFAEEGKVEKAKVIRLLKLAS